jgi:hypothetical protein
VASNDARALGVSTVNLRLHLNQTLLEVEQKKPATLVGGELGAGDVLEARLVVAQACYGHAHKKRALV